MNSCTLQITLLSDATFGRGNSIPGLVDQDVALDQLGCPYLHGRTVKGLLSEACADLLFALPVQDGDWSASADALFGLPGSKQQTQGILHVGHAQLPADLRQALQYHQAPPENAMQQRWTRNEVIESLTTIRQQTALEVGGAPDPHTLRAVRVIIRQTVFHAPLTFQRPLTDSEKGLLAACVKGLRRLGSARNRGRGRVTAALLANAADQAENPTQMLSDEWFTTYFTPYFASEVLS